MCNLYSMTKSQQAVRDLLKPCATSPATCRRCRPNSRISWHPLSALRRMAFESR